MNGGSINIDGRLFTGNNVSVNNGKVTVDGVVQDGELIGNIDIVVHGDVINIENECGTVTANEVGEISTTSGDIKCGNVAGSAKTMSGDINCGNIGGNAKTMSGDITHK